MAFNIANFAPIGNTSKKSSGVGSTTLRGAPSIYSYLTSDSVTGASGVNAAGYFNELVRTLSVGDLIYVVGGAGSGGTLAVRLMYVNSNNGTTVDVVDGTTLATTDTY
jgi:hypothetical protein